MALVPVDKKDEDALLPRRKHWDKEKYNQLAAERTRKEEEEVIEDLLGQVEENKHQEVVVREPLSRRKHTVEIDSKIGKMMVINPSTENDKRGGWYCETCDCQLKDSMTYLDHINGKKHQRKLGMSMRVIRSTVASVREKLASLKRQRDDPSEKLDIVERLLKREAEEKTKKSERRERKKRKKEEKKKLKEEIIDPELKGIGFDFSSFGKRR